MELFFVGTNSMQIAYFVAFDPGPAAWIFDANIYNYPIFARPYRTYYHEAKQAGYIRAGTSSKPFFEALLILYVLCQSFKRSGIDMLGGR